MLRSRDEKRPPRKAPEERQGWIPGGLIVTAVGAGLGIMIALEGRRTWTLK